MDEPDNAPAISGKLWTFVALMLGAMVLVAAVLVGFILFLRGA